jgi:hypothetical protein
MFEHPCLAVPVPNSLPSKVGHRQLNYSAPASLAMSLTRCLGLANICQVPRHRPQLVDGCSEAAKDAIHGLLLRPVLTWCLPWTTAVTEI